MKILYFTQDFSLENIAYAKEHGLIIRDAGAYQHIDFLESCDAVYGQVPEAYKDAYPIFALPQFDKTEKKQKSSKQTGKPTAHTNDTEQTTSDV